MIGLPERESGRKGERKKGRVEEREKERHNRAPFSFSLFLPLPLSPFLPLSLSLLLLFGACDSSFEPITQEPDAFFAVFGFLDTAADTQFVRVSPVRATLEPLPETRNAVAITTHLETGETVTWRDSLVVLDDGQPGLLFYAKIAVKPGDSYRFEVQGADGKTTRAVTQVPPRVVLDREPVAQDDNRRLVQRVTFLDQSSISFRLRVRYEVTPPGAAEPVVITLPVFGAGLVTPRGLETTLHLELDRPEVLRRLGLPPTETAVVLHSLGLEIEHLSDEWQTPDVPLNIENGFGFFGAVARYILSWTLDDTEIEQLSYQVPG